MAERVVIERLGARGDGIAACADGPVHVPRTLPGETVIIDRHGSRGDLLSVEAASDDRIEPFCPYFAACGGCAAQHMGTRTYAGWKAGILAGALRQARIDQPSEPLLDAHGEGRRRITLHARRRDGRTLVGYMAARSHDLVAIDRCPIIAPALKPAPQVALALAERLAGSGKPLDIQISATETGLDVDIRGHGRLGEPERQALVAAARELDLARLSLHGDVLVAPRTPILTMGRARVPLPPAAFIQATRLGEETLAGLALSACAGARRVADLFSGCGPFALRLAETAEVHALESDAAALAALERAARGTPALRRVTTERRDLFRRPLLGPELARFDAVIADPPRAGAEAQSRQLAASRVALVVLVSCDPGTFARDTAILIGGGYRLERLVPVDQFKYSAHIEIVGVFRRASQRRR